MSLFENKFENSYSQIAKKLQLRTFILWQTIDKSGEQKRGASFYRGKEEAGRSCFEQKFVGGK